MSVWRSCVAGLLIAAATGCATLPGMHAPAQPICPAVGRMAAGCVGTSTHIGTATEIPIPPQGRAIPGDEIARAATSRTGSSTRITTVPPGFLLAMGLVYLLIIVLA